MNLPPRCRRWYSVALLLFAGAVVALQAACGSLAPPVASVSPADIPALEEELKRDTADLQLVARLATAYRAAKRLEDAKGLLQRALLRSPDDPSLQLLLGLTYEDLGELTLARELYEATAARRGPARLRGESRRRLVLLQYQLLKEAARGVVAREAELASAPPKPRTLAVFPFVFLGGDEQLRPLSRALADMLVTDLSQTNRLEVLERTQVQMLLDEIGLQEQGLTSPDNAVRSGRLLSAERVVQGTMMGAAETLELQATVVPVASADLSTPVRATDALSRLFDLEKRLALEIYGSLGIQLTAAERALVNRRPTENIQALLQYGLGLQAADAGDFARAAEHFRAALAADPRFARAREQAEATEAAAAATETTTQQVASLVTIQLVPPMDLTATEMLVPNPGRRDPASEATGVEGIGRKAVLDLIIRRP